MSNATHGWKDGDRAMVILEDVTIGGAHAKGQRKDMDAWLPFACFHPLPADDPHAATVSAIVEAAEAYAIEGPTRERFVALHSAILARLAAPTASHAALKDAVVEAAVAWRDAQEPTMSRAEFLNAGDRLFGAVLALNAARTPPDPVAELRDAAMAVLAIIERGGIPTPALAAGLRAAVEAMRRGA